MTMCFDEAEIFPQFNVPQQISFFLYKSIKKNFKGLKSLACLQGLKLKIRKICLITLKVCLQKIM